MLQPVGITGHYCNISLQQTNTAVPLQGIFCYGSQLPCLNQNSKSFISVFLLSLYAEHIIYKINISLIFSPLKQSYSPSPPDCSLYSSPSGQTLPK